MWLISFEQKKSTIEDFITDQLIPSSLFRAFRYMEQLEEIVLAWNAIGRPSFRSDGSCSTQ
jgi:hypothetical protein